MPTSQSVGSHGFLDLTSLRRPSHPPNAADWVCFRTRIIELYQNQDLPLHQVCSFMEATHGFFASPKMYKDRFRSWDVHKKYNEADVRNLFERLADGSTTFRDAKIHGHPVKWARVRRRVSEGIRGFQLSSRHKRQLDCLVQEEKLARQQTPSHAPQTQNIEDAFINNAAPSSPALEALDRRGHQVLVSVKAYLTERVFASGGRGYIESWLPPDVIPVGHRRASFSEMIHPSELNQNLARGLSMLIEGRDSPAAPFLLCATNVTETVLAQEHGTLTSCLLDAFHPRNIPTYPRIGHTISESTFTTARRTLGLRHPVTLLCEFLHICTINQAASSIFHFWGHFCRLYASALTIKSPMTIYINQKYLEKLIEVCQYDEALAHMQRSLDPVFSSLFDSPPDVAVDIPVNIPASLWYLRHRARLLRCLGDFGQALATLKVSRRVITAELNKLRVGIAGSPILEEIFRTIDEVALYHATQASFTAEEYSQYSFLAQEVAVTLCAAVRGDQDSKTLSMVSTLEQNYRQIGLADRARSLREAYPRVFASNWARFETMSRHHFPCRSCGNGPNTQIFCDQHMMSLDDPEEDMDVIAYRVGIAFAFLPERYD
ncbi:hypothetical protein PV10_03759 [Exophiala mesophila]|uniref:Clr5 domain-containing protein n=1 Tax=Exophiala mesophila TaxID=212818 RepID=A0A0D2A098_EXOME|nr:uncharacterized protein PV10_03759 [Exophiala mesophila]KIV92463.1 hypothetical protein PV10_03759 [Exophiala mesophila]